MTVIVPQREVVIVERVHGRRYGWWKQSQYRAITVYYDGSRFYCAVRLPSLQKGGGV